MTRYFRLRLHFDDEDGGKNRCKHVLSFVSFQPLTEIVENDFDQIVCNWLNVFKEKNKTPTDRKHLYGMSLSHNCYPHYFDLG